MICSLSETLTGEEKQLAQGVRCSHVYLLSTLEDLVLSSLLLPQITFKNKPIKTLEAILPFLPPKDSRGARQVTPESLCLLLKPTVLCILVSTVGEKI